MDWLEVFGEQTVKFRAAVCRADLATAVPSCPHWTFSKLVVHVGRFLDQVTRYLTSGSMTRLRPPPAQEVTDPLAYLDEQLGPAAATLAGTPANRPVWTFSPAAPDLAWVWHRRAAHELNLRRWDAQAALRTLEPTDREQAVDAIDEQLGTLLAAQLYLDSPPETKGTAVVACTDGPESWFVALTPGEAPQVRPAADDEGADATLRGKASNLVYQLRGRMPLTGSGNPEMLRAVRLS